MEKQRLATVSAGLLSALGLLVATARCSDVSGDAGTATQAGGLTVPAGFIDEVYATGLTGMTAMEFAPDGRLFVAEQTGRLRVVKNGALQATPFLQVTVDSNGERGLLGIAFDPNFASNRFVYVYYTTPNGGVHNRLSRFTANGDVAVAGSETVLMDLEPLSGATNHNGGAIHFGTDGKLYIAVGENANRSNAQTLGNRLGKMLRINSDGSIPSDNPFFNQATGANRSIWAMGLRNPFTFAVQPGTGKIHINDVGENTWEEVDVGMRGANYGWPAAEGPNGNRPGDTAPIYSYSHSEGCSITGATFYNPATVQFVGWVGHYFFADFCSNWIRRMNTSGAVSNFATGGSSITDLKVGADGALYYLNRGNGRVGRVRSSTSSNLPTISVQPANQRAGIGQTAKFSVSASGSGTLMYQWQRNGANIAGATSPDLTLTNVQSGDSGAQFRVMVSNGSGTVTSNAATLTVPGRAPVATITAPVNNSLYSAGQTINYSASATDQEDGTLPASAYSWTIRFYHADTPQTQHFHPFMGPINGATGGVFTIPNMGETSVNVWYRIILTVTDSSGVTNSDADPAHDIFVDLKPCTANIALQTSPAGLQTTFDGTPVTTPTSIASVVGMIRTLGAPAQSGGGTSYTFASWSDGGAATHNITTPASNTTFTATFAAGTGPFPIKINFQVAGAATPAGYVADTGELFGTRNGLSYGWNILHTDVTRERNVHPDQRLDTLCHMHGGGVWEVAVANGTYNVFASVGDPSFASTYTLNVEGVNYWNAVSLGVNQFLSATKVVTVSDGRLTINQGSAGDKFTRINYVEIAP